MALLSASAIEEIRGDLSRVAYYYQSNFFQFDLLLGSPSWSESAFKAAWSVYVAHQLSEYGDGPPTLEISVLLDSPAIMCSQFSTIALHLFDEFSLQNDLLKVIGWDDSEIGDHSQLLFDDGTTSLLLDPTVGLVVENVSLQGFHAGVSYGDYHSFLKDDSLKWYSDNIVSALKYSLLHPWDITYFVPGFDEWLYQLNAFKGVVINIGPDREVVVGTQSNELLDGGAGADYIYALGGNDTLVGGAGIDIMYGGGGNDRYHIDDYRDKVSEWVSPVDSSDAGGIDKIISSVSFRLPEFVEHMTLIGAGDRNIIGNALDNVLYGNSGKNSIYGGAGSDTLNGGGGIDTLYGGAGNDRYYIDDYRDKVSEWVSPVDSSDAGGIDKIISSVSFRLPEFVEHMTLIGAGDRNIIGNALDNVLYGNSGKNSIYGGSGADTISGGLGGDKLFGGLDKVRDVFVYKSQAESTMSEIDSIFNFLPGVDKIDLTAIDADINTSQREVFNFSGTNAAPHSVWFKDVGADTYLHADVNGDQIRDFSVKIVGISEFLQSDIWF